MKKNVILGITGSVATVMFFKLVQELERNDFRVKVVTTKASWLFVLSVFFRKPKKIFKFLKIWESGFLEFTGAFSKEKGKVRHINLVKWADTMLIAPASANTISKIVYALADNFLTTIALAMPQDKKIFIAPAMNVNMWQNPFFQKNIRELEKEQMYQVIGPITGILQCGDEGIGKMASVSEIVERMNNGRS